MAACAARGYRESSEIKGAGSMTANADFLKTWAAYLSDLQSLLRPRFTDEQWAGLFSRTDTPEQAAQKLLDLTAVEPQPRLANLWTMLDLSTGHLRRGDYELLELYRGPGEDHERDRDPGQSLFVTPCVAGWIISTSGCLAPDGEMSPENAASLEADRAEAIAEMKDEGFSDEFVALFKFAYENGASDLRFHGDADPIPGFPLFDLISDKHEDDDIEAAPSAPGV